MVKCKFLIAIACILKCAMILGQAAQNSNASELSSYAASRAPSNPNGEKMAAMQIRSEIKKCDGKNQPLDASTASQPISEAHSVQTLGFYRILDFAGYDGLLTSGGFLVRVPQNANANSNIVVLDSNLVAF